ncbi:MAG: DNA repair protein RecO [Christensenellaceae bacterium]|jgi:DNA repair protein RecO|nr:DNA repair protein RecO [Christensenellaceae bacterium]
METKFSALCVRSSEYREKDKILTLISPENGRVVAVAKGVRAPNSKLKMAATQLCFGEYTCSVLGTGNAILKGCLINDNFLNCWTDIYRNAAAQVVVEALDKIAFENSEFSAETIAAIRTLVAINYSQTFPYLPLAWYLVKLLPSIGVNPRETDLPSSFISLLCALESTLPDELDGLDVTSKELRSFLHYLDLLLKISDLGKISSLDSALSLWQF